MGKGYRLSVCYRWQTSSDQPRQISHLALSSSGFSLIEILISLLLVSISVLGVLGVQAKITQQNLNAYSRSQAVSLTYEMAERIRLNPAAAKDGQYNLQLNNNPVAGSSLASKDKAEWRSLIAALLPEGKGGINLNGDQIDIMVCWTRLRGHNCDEFSRLRVQL